MVQQTETTTEDYVDTTPQTVTRQTVTPSPVVDTATPTYVQNSDPMANTIAASNLIQTVVWSVVLIVAVVVGILVLIHYNII